jgi:dTDP-L-rhamnose 4-epimerase
MINKMNSLVTGGAGFIGLFLCERLHSLGHSVSILDNLDPQAHPSGRLCYIPPETEFQLNHIRAVMFGRVRFRMPPSSCIARRL